MAVTKETKKTASAAEQTAQQEAVQAEKETYVSMNDIPWEKLKSRFGINRRDFEGDSPMSRGRRDALLSGKWTPTVRGFASEDNISSEMDISMRVRKVTDRETGEQRIRIYTESPIHESLGCEYRFRDVAIPEDVRKELSETGCAGRIVELDEPEWSEDNKRIPMVSDHDITVKADVWVEGKKLFEKGQVIKAGTPLVDFETGRPMYRTRRNQYFLSLNPYTRRVKGMLATEEVRGGIKVPSWMNLATELKAKEMDALKNGAPVNVICIGKNGNRFLQCLQFNAASGFVEHNDRHPKYREGLDLFRTMMGLSKESESEKQSQGMKV